MSEHAVLGPGVCAGFGTANTMHLACEALGMALPGSTPVRANSEPMWRAVDEAGAPDRRDGRRGPEAAGHHDPGGIPQRGHDHLVGQRLDQLGQAPAGGGGRGRGATPTCTGCSRRSADGVPLLSRDQAQRRDAHRGVRGRGRHPRAHEAAGAAARHRRAARSPGRPSRRTSAGVAVADDEVIRPPERALGRRPTIVLIRGSLCPDGGIVKLAVADDRRLEFTGPAARLRVAARGARRGARGQGPRPARSWCCAARASPAPPAWAWPRSWCSRWTAPG